MIGVSALRPSHPMGAPRESKYLGRHGAALWTPSIWTVTALHLIVGGATNLAAALSLVVPAFTPNRDAYRCRHRDHGNGDRDRRSSARAVYQHRPAATVQATIALCFLIGELISIVWLGVAGHPIVSQIGEAVSLCAGAAVGRGSQQGGGSLPERRCPPQVRDAVRGGIQLRSHRPRTRCTRILVGGNMDRRRRRDYKLPQFPVSPGNGHVPNPGGGA